MRYKLDPCEITARFPSTCAESGKPIKKGERILYYPNGKKVFLIGHAPKQEADFRSFQSLAFEEDNGYCEY